MELKVKKWAVREDDDKTVVEGTYAVMMGLKEVATQTFNQPSGYGGTEIAFPRELMDEIRIVSAKVEEAIQTSF